MNIFIEKNKVFNESVSESGLAVYTILRYFYEPNVEQYFISINHLSFIMFKRIGKRRDIEFIRSGLDNLIENKFIRIVSKNSSFEYILDLSSINYDIEKDGYYISISLQEVRDILGIKGIRKGRLLKYFLTICSCFNNSSKIEEKYKNKIAMVTLETLSNNSKLPYDTCIKYNNLLEKNNLIFIHRNVNRFGSYDEKNKFNHYCKCNDIDILKEYLKSDSRFDSEMSDSAMSNYNRSMAQKYNALCKGKVYSKNVLREIYDYCVMWNQKKQREYDDAVSKGFSPTLLQKDMSIFEKFDLTN